MVQQLNLITLDLLRDIAELLNQFIRSSMKSSNICIVCNGKSQFFFSKNLKRFHMSDFKCLSCLQHLQFDTLYSLITIIQCNKQSIYKWLMLIENWNGAPLKFKYFFSC